MSPWILVVIFSYVGSATVEHNGFSVGPFYTRAACVAAGKAVETPGSKWTCVQEGP